MHYNYYNRGYVPMKIYHLWVYANWILASPLSLQNNMLKGVCQLGQDLYWALEHEGRSTHFSTFWCDSKVAKADDLHLQDVN